MSDATTENTHSDDVEIPVVATATATPAPEICPAEQLDELRDAHDHAAQLEAQAANLVEQAKILRGHAWGRVSRRLKLSPADSIDLTTGAVTRGKPDEVRS